jgi:sterol desaturase/sphingolipid hydroxylase (fatty acid hydroxylase superfamily)
MMFILGLSSWILIEYLMHRFALHGFADKGHTPHHENPRDKSNLFIDWRMVAIVSVAVCGTALLFLDGLSVMQMYLGIVTGYVAYEFVHYRVHNCKVTSRLMKYLRKHHLQHHFSSEDCNYSVICPPIDKLFNTTLRHTRSR